MPYFKYTARDRTGKLKEGRIKSFSEREAKETLIADGMILKEIEELTGLLYKDISFGSAVKSQQFVMYLRQFSTLLKAGISVIDATSILAEQTNSKRLQYTLKSIEIELRAGNPFSEAAEAHKKVFPALFTNMLRAGEVGGNLDEVLERLATYYEKQYLTRQKVISALSYPAVVGSIAIIVVVFLLSFVVPTFADLFRSFDSELPLITKMVLSAGSVFKKVWWLLILLFIGMVVAFKVIQENRRYKYYFDLLILKIPIFGSLFQKAVLARMTRTLGSLFSSSVPILHAVSIVEKIVGNEVVAKVIRESRNALEKGESIAGPMEAHWIFPPLVTQMVRVGEKTGSLDTMLDKVADFYETEVDIATERIKSLIEPLMIVVLAGIVGVIVASIAIPMFQIFENIG
ncbi:type II secretion system protein F [Anaerobacillus alkalidiazotrophicus]|uniref:Type II secretion system protein F n=1 Tax=Anaerobacillus alkalidiazotrophicus TaxID=472963 RepID=A0A1S2M0X2_9BACI|nr:type II secretion system F family protein [Anaerobacillus alkalidiazotrophicus]OIJ18369.1 type II secretion system protein F [Anaerobacillus alkalidiazotrophicus]OIJ19848.1 type II secretion system protein F [Anaerobacillus alkalidiazotrophicus]